MRDVTGVDGRPRERLHGSERVLIWRRRGCDGRRRGRRGDVGEGQWVGESVSVVVQLPDRRPGDLVLPAVRILLSSKGKERGVQDGRGEGELDEVVVWRVGSGCKVEEQAVPQRSRDL